MGCATLRGMSQGIPARNVERDTPWNVVGKRSAGYCTMRGNCVSFAAMRQRKAGLPAGVFTTNKDQTKWRGPLRAAPPSPLATSPTVFDLRRIPKKVAKKAPAKKVAVKKVAKAPAKKCCCKKAAAKKAPAKKAVAKKPVK